MNGEPTPLGQYERAVRAFANEPSLLLVQAADRAYIDAFAYVAWSPWYLEWWRYRRFSKLHRIHEDARSGLHQTEVDKVITVGDQVEVPHKSLIVEAEVLGPFVIMDFAGTPYPDWAHFRDVHTGECFVASLEFCVPVDA